LKVALNTINPNPKIKVDIIFNPAPEALRRVSMIGKRKIEDAKGVTKIHKLKGKQQTYRNTSDRLS
jgi:hypothetical protein